MKLMLTIGAIVFCVSACASKKIVMKDCEQINGGSLWICKPQTEVK